MASCAPALRLPSAHYARSLVDDDPGAGQRLNALVALLQQLAVQPRLIQI